MVRFIEPDFGATAGYVFLPLGTGTAERSHAALRTLITTERCGSMGLADADDRARRAALFERLGIAPRRVAALRQTHSTTVHFVTRGAADPLEGDGLVTADRNVVLTVTVADCVPISLHDRRTGAFATVHSGRRGTGIARAALMVMRRWIGTDPRDVEAIVGPGIGPCCYNVPQERALLFRDAFPGSIAVRGGVAYLDLIRANIALLADAGVDDITAVRPCTSCTPRLLSYRRQGPERYGRMVVVTGFL